MLTGDGDRLLQFIERVEACEIDRAAAKDARNAVYAEAKDQGYDVPIMRRIVALRKQHPDKRREGEEILGLYLAALGME